MTLLAGFLNRDPERPLPNDLCSAIDAQLDRAGAVSERSSVRAGGLFLSRVDIGAFEGSGLLRDGTVTAAVTGEPLFEGSRTGDRDRDLQALVGAWREHGLEGVLRSANGQYAATLYDEAAHELCLVTDKLGIRPLFVCETPDRIYFASALWIMEEMEAVPKTVDLRAVAEASVFGTPLGSRTPYATIRVLRDGEYQRSAGGGKLEREQYWRWDRVPTSAEPESELRERVYQAFRMAVDRRLGSRERVDTGLSGGLDSRALVCVLDSMVETVRTFNFAIPGSKDAEYGRRFAEHLGTDHHQIDAAPGRAQFQHWLAEQIHRLDGGADGPEAGVVAWSGDGGSVGLGHVYLTPDVVAKGRTGGAEAVARAQLRNQRAALSRRLLTRRAHRELEPVPLQGLTEELASVEPDDPGRAVFLFFLRNDQRRHLADHFETIHESRMELELPFFDSAFLETVLTVPLDDLLRHGFYNRWVDVLPCDMKAVPWQVYPGHIAPTWEGEDELADQWRDPRPDAWRRRRREEAVCIAREMLWDDHFPDAVLRRPILRLAYWLTRLGIRDLGYLIDAARWYTRYARPAAGRISWPERGDPDSPSDVTA